MSKKIYGKLITRAGRSNWAAHECGVDFEQIDVAFDNKPAELLAANPAGTTPAYVDGDFCMTESFAIGLYLARKYRPQLMGENLEEGAKVYQWTLFAATDLEKAVQEMLNNSGIDASHPLDTEKFAAGRVKFEKLLARINSELEGRDYLVGEHFTLADLNVACLIAFPVVCSVDRSAYANVQRWLKSCTSRPAFSKSLPAEMLAMVLA